jgi:hypothetical protein
VLRAEFTQPTTGGPCIFEIPLAGSDRIDVMVVWDKFDRIRSEDRTNLILEAYGGQTENIAQALGVTMREALQQNLLPYQITPLARQGDVNKADLEVAMLAEGGMRGPNGIVELRLPDVAIAEEALRRLNEKVPKGYWSISEVTADLGAGIGLAISGGT